MLSLGFGVLLCAAVVKVVSRSPVFGLNLKP